MDEAELKDNPYIFSHTVSVPPMSYVDPRQPFNEQAPPCVYLTEEILLTPLPASKDEIFKGLEEQEYGGLVCHDKEALEK